MYIFTSFYFFSPGRLPDVRGFWGAKSGVRDILDGGPSSAVDSSLET